MKVFTLLLPGLLAATTAQLLRGPLNGTNQTLQVDHEAKRPLLALAFYTRYSFYTPSDKHASVIINMTYSDHSGAAMSEVFWDIVDAGKGISSSVVEDSIAVTLVDWVDIKPNTTHNEFIFPLNLFPKQDWGYSLHLWATDDNNNVLYNAYTTLRMFDDKQGREYARRDRLTGNVLVYRGDDTWQVTDYPEHPRSASSMPLSTAIMAANDITMASSTARSPAISAENDWLFQQPGYDSLVTDDWWRKLLPVTVHTTTWKVIQERWRNESLETYLQEIHVQGFNVIHPLNGSEDSTVPVDAKIRRLASRMAKSNEIYLLYDIDFSSPGNQYRKQHIELEHKGPDGVPVGSFHKRRLEKQHTKRAEEPKPISGETKLFLEYIYQGLLWGMVKLEQPAFPLDNTTANLLKFVYWLEHPSSADIAYLVKSTAPLELSEQQQREYEQSLREQLRLKAWYWGSDLPLEHKLDIRDESARHHARNLEMYVRQSDEVQGRIELGRSEGPYPDKAKRQRFIDGVKSGFRFFVQGQGHASDIISVKRNDYSTYISWLENPQPGDIQDLTDFIRNYHPFATRDAIRTSLTLAAQMLKSVHPSMTERQALGNTAPSFLLSTAAVLVVLPGSSVEKLQRESVRSGVRDAISLHVREPFSGELLDFHGKKEQKKPDCTSVAENANDWQNDVLEKIHHHVLEGFEQKVNKEVNDWFGVNSDHHNDPQSWNRPIQQERDMHDSCSASDTLTDAPCQVLRRSLEVEPSYSSAYDSSSSEVDENAWQDDLMDRLHKNVMEAFEEKTQNDLWKLNHPGEAKPPQSGAQQATHVVFGGESIFTTVSVPFNTFSMSSLSMGQSYSTTTTLTLPTTVFEVLTSRADALADADPTNRPLKHVLRDFGACARDPYCDVETRDFKERLATRSKATNEQERVYLDGIGTFSTMRGMGAHHPSDDPNRVGFSDALFGSEQFSRRSEAARGYVSPSSTDELREDVLTLFQSFLKQIANDVGHGKNPRAQKRSELAQGESASDSRGVRGDVVNLFQDVMRETADKITHEGRYSGSEDSEDIRRDVVQIFADIMQQTANDLAQKRHHDGLDKRSEAIPAFHSPSSDDDLQKHILYVAHDIMRQSASSLIHNKKHEPHRGSRKSVPKWYEIYGGASDSSSDYSQADEGLQKRSYNPDGGKGYTSNPDSDLDQHMLHGGMSLYADMLQKGIMDVREKENGQMDHEGLDMFKRGVEAHSEPDSDSDATRIQQDAIDMFAHMLGMSANRLSQTEEEDYEPPSLWNDETDESD